MSSEKVLLWKPVSDEEQNAYLRYTKSSSHSTKNRAAFRMKLIMPFKPFSPIRAGPKTPYIV